MPSAIRLNAADGCRHSGVRGHLLGFGHAYQIAFLQEDTSAGDDAIINFETVEHFNLLIALAGTKRELGQFNAIIDIDFHLGLTQK
jgi:hypothetical protein